MSLDEYYELDIDPVDDLSPKQAFYAGLQMAHAEMWCSYRQPFTIVIPARNVDRICSWLRRHEIGYCTAPSNIHGYVEVFALPEGAEDELDEDDEDDEDEDDEDTLLLE